MENEDLTPEFFMPTEKSGRRVPTKKNWSLKSQVFL